MLARVTDVDIDLSALPSSGQSSNRSSDTSTRHLTRGHTAPGGERKGRTMKSIHRATAVTLAAVVVVAAGIASIATASSVKTTSITVAALIPGATPEAKTQFANQIKAFEKVNPNIKVKGIEYQWLGSTFAAKLAAGTLPMVLTVPFTDARTLGDNGQLADLTPLAKKLPYFNLFNPAVIAEGITAKGKVVGIPTAAYAQALHYNRKLFTQAGLDPNKPPTTWAQVRQYAKQIADKTGTAGFAQMGANDNTAGWILTTLTYALGGRMEVGRGTKATATLNNPYTAQALDLLKKMRWTDNSMGSTFDYSWGTINQAFAAGKIGMFINGSDVYTFMVQTANLDPSTYGIATLPVANNATAGVLGGGTIAAVRPDVKGAQLAAAVKWIDFFYEQPLINKAQAIRNAKSLIANKQPVGVPTFPVFNKKQYVLANTWLKPYFNVPRAQMAPFLTGIFSKKLFSEPAASTQSVYHALDPTVQAVFSDKDTDVFSSLDQANDVAQKAIGAGN
jgi:multiple sugar transport system substrate-binding protein